MSLRRGDADLIDAPRFRVRIEPDAANGLREPSDVMADKVLTVPRPVVSPEPFGRLSPADLERVDEALLDSWPGWTEVWKTSNMGYRIST